METSITVQATFGAAHRIPDFPPCSKAHGHQWDVRATATGDINPRTAWPRGAETLKSSLEELVDELAGRNLDEMLPGVPTSPLGIASSILERLVLVYPNISAVEVECSDGTSGLIRRSQPTKGGTL